MDFSEKTILVVNKSPSLRKAYEDALRDLGFSVFSFFDTDLPPFKNNVYTKVINILRRKFLNDKGYLQRVEKKHEIKFLIKRSVGMQKTLKDGVDYTLFFRADRYPENVILSLKLISRKMISYQYDGMEVCSKIIDYKKHFNRIFLFDKNDLEKYADHEFLPLTNNWFPDCDMVRYCMQDFFYVGVGIEERKQKFLNLQKFCGKKFKIKAHLTTQDYQQEEHHGGVSFLHRGMSYEENMYNVKHSRAILDFKLPYHDGLSYRFFECMNYEKKLITNNASVKHYDFYHPDNIFITDYYDLAGLEEFMEKPYHKVDESIRQKYGIENWIKYVLDVNPHIKIDLPG